MFSKQEAAQLKKNSGLPLGNLSLENGFFIIPKLKIFHLSFCR